MPSAHLRDRNQSKKRIPLNWGIQLIRRITESNPTFTKLLGYQESSTQPTPYSFSISHIAEFLFQIASRTSSDKYRYYL
jgi:hypothetical protein